MRTLLTAVIICLCASAGVACLSQAPWSAARFPLAASLLCLAYVVCRICLFREQRVGSTTRPRHEGRQLAEVYRATTEALASAIAAKDVHEQHHVKRVRSICELVADRLGLDANTCDGIRVAAALHDIGNLGVPGNILLKPGPLDPDEFTRMRHHAVTGARIIESVDYPWDVAEMVLHHHEKFDGTGYPDHLAGETIPIGARIIAVAEVYDALVSDRCYRRGWTSHEVMEHIAKLSGSHFDPVIVDAFMALESRVESLTKHHPSDGHAVPASREESGAAAEVIAQANQELVSLFDMAQTLSSTLEVDEVSVLLAHRTRRLVDSAMCAVFVVDEAHPQQLVARAAVGRCQEIFRGARARLGKGVTGKVASNMKAYIGNYDATDLTLGMEGHLALDFKSCISAPIVSFGELLGTINLYDFSAHAFSSNDLRTLTLVASKAALAIQNAGAFERVQESAIRDPLTGLYNQRYLRTCLEQEVSRAGRSGEPLSILGVDLDNFKCVNDTYGHQVGDVVLKSMAEVFHHELRDYDIVVRNGGDEFVVILPGTPEGEALRIAQRIRRGVECYGRRHVGLNTKTLSASFGLVTYPNDAADLDELLAQADAAMYQDKRARKQGELAA